MKIYLDDIRKAPVGWERAYSADQVIIMLLMHEQVYGEKIEEISLDHDLGACEQCMEDFGVTSAEEWLEKTQYQSMPNCEHYGTGYDVLLWIEEQVVTSNYVPPKIHIHTANPAAREKMYAAVESIERRLLSR